MYLFYVLSFFLVVSGYVSGWGSSSSDRTDEMSIETTAAQMYVYHEAAMEFCEANPASCNSEKVVPASSIVPNIPPVAASGKISNGWFETRIRNQGGTLILFTYPPMHRSGGLDAQAEIKNVFGNALKKLVPTYMYSGNYSSNRIYDGQGNFLSFHHVVAGLYIPPETPMIAEVLQ
jgi:hypothetical protein